ncbi:hypothetical protein F1645_08145 [Novacetimonas hansenii]|uniref:Uncharacterized protein n=2 Tax=Novacetimonas hansenii TaxID=436 RepID=A0ABQ0SCV9_NOVHA|nr:hypothetical protein [Novacetimonas hansenii]EFG82813.1 hypothetical protein GXY_16424 [Novacetimonas hansenii ATCC 23769]GAN84659.1 hypothetical protein Gaha_0199_002 [Novacetimonas hansenii JCM 7643]GBQ60244.1 hypothetical protein AA0243_2277 [Novacetimonas hansenii NRIC 0243]GEC63023.1 hypothetical protein GHA01_08720 [Novacetimonas hansenii]
MHVIANMAGRNMAAVYINDIAPAPSGRKGRDMAISPQFSSLSDWELKWTLFITYETDISVYVSKIL